MSFLGDVGDWTGNLLFGKKSGIKPMTSFSSNTPGFNISSSGGNTTVTANNTVGRQALNSRFPRILSDIDTFRGQVKPGFGKLTEARVRPITNARQRAIGDLKTNLERRKVAGSSFGNESLVRAETEFANQEAGVRAKSFLEELDVSFRMLDQEHKIIQADLARELAEAGLGGQMATAFSKIAADQMDSERSELINRANNQAAFVQEMAGQAAGYAIGKWG